MKTFLLFLLLAQSPAAITLDPAGNFRVSGWADAANFSTPQWAQIFSVQVDLLADVPPLLGSYRVEQGALIFVPQYPVQAGVPYRATLRIPGKDPVVQRFTIPKPDQTPTTLVERVYPTTNLLPENQLKFYIHFSAPMSRGEAYSRIHLLDEKGAEVDVPFLTLTEELWDRDGMRFTLFFDPGRVKRGLVPHNELGAPLNEGRKYTLLIDHDWLDAEGKQLKQDFKKSFSVGPADRKALDEDTWRVVAPKAGTLDPVAVEFPEPMDHALLQRQLGVIDASGNFVEGSIQIDRDETRWRFIPRSFWKAGSYSVQVGTVIADLAGNMIDHPFDVDVFEKVDEKIVRETRDLPFKVN
jgi:hypothetical protein